MSYVPIEQLIVYFEHCKEKHRLGRLARYNRQILFEYDADFIEKSLPVSPIKLPLKPGVFVPDDNLFKGLFGLFNDSLPDGWGRLLLDRALTKQGIHVRELGALDRLAFVGQGGMGALSYEPAMDTFVSDKNNQSLLVLDRLADESRQMLSGATEDIFPELLALNGASAGARPKIVVKVSQDKREMIYGPDCEQPGFESWMIKFPSMLDPHDIGPLEYAYSLMARDAGVDIPQTHLFLTEQGHYFGVQRFDRKGAERIHMHSLCGLIHADFRLPSLDYDTILRVVQILTKNTCEVEKAFVLACFNVFAHNRDDHSKNFSFILNNQGEWQLSSAYDLTFSHGPHGEHSTTVMGEGRAPTIEHLKALGKKHGLKRALLLIEQVREAVFRWKTYAETAGVSERTLREIAF